MTFERGQAAQKHVSEPPHLVLVSAVIYTGDPPRRRAEAIAIQGERIVAVGSNREIRALAGAKTRVVDLHGRFAMPGFNDAHIHLANGGQARLQIDFEGAKRSPSSSSASAHGSTNTSPANGSPGAAGTIPSGPSSASRRAAISMPSLRFTP